jgi:protein ImuB
MERWQTQAERLGSALPDDLPQALSVEGPHGPIIHAANRAAHLAGITNGARVVDMRALCPAMRVEYADPGGDQAALARLALWARRWCPWTAVDGQGLILDTTGSDHLWGGEPAMLEEIEARLSLLGFSARLALAPTWGAAWAIARYGPIRAIWRGQTDLAFLPVAALRLEADTVLLLHRLGLKTIGALTDVPRLSLARRFSRAGLASNPLLRLDQMTGHLVEPLAPPAMPLIFDPTHYLPGLCTDLCVQLSAAAHGARRLRLSVYRTDGEVGRIDVTTASPSREAAHLAFLFRDRVEKINPGFGFDLISLEALISEPLGMAQNTLTGGVDEVLELSHLIDRLTVRFGAGAISRPVSRASHIPERAEMRAAPMAPAPNLPSPLAERPLRLLDHAEEIRVLYAVPEGPPAQFVWRRLTHRTVRYAGPERIAPEWWQDRPSTRLRDYFKVEDDKGRRYWLYREGLHDDGRGGDPRWFLHGMFA